MRASAVVTIQPMMGGENLVVSLTAPPTLSGSQPALFPLDRSKLPPLLNTSQAKIYGAALRTALSIHPDIREVLKDLDRNTPADCNLMFQLLAPELEDIRWETTSMWPDGFFAIHTPTALSRIAGPAKSGGNVRVFAWPLTVLAFVSAAGIDGRDERDALVTQVKAARAAGLDVELDIYLGDSALLRETVDAVAAGLQGVTARPMPASAEALLDVVNERQAQIVHFFCHGISEGSQQFLELATIVNTVTKAERGSVQLPAFRFWEQPGAQAAWIVVLNCCESAAAPGAGAAIGSMAYRMVRDGGLPACMGMSEPIDWRDANLVAANFYKRLFVDLAPLAAAAGDVLVDFSSAVLAPRQALNDRHGSKTQDPSSVRWSLPALYTSGAPLRVQPLANVSLELRIRLRAVARFLAAQPADTPPGVRADALNLNQLDAIPEGLRPDWLGRFEKTALTSDQERTLARVARVLKQLPADVDEAERRETRDALLAAIPPEAWPDLQGRRPLTAKDQTRIKCVADYLRSLPVGSDPALRDEALALLGDLPKNRRPDADGNLAVSF